VLDIDIARLTPDAGVAELCAELVRARSENPPGKEAETAAIIADWAHRHRADVSVTEPVAGRPNVIARFHGAGRAPGIAFSGHTDVVPVSKDEGTRWSRDPWGGEIVDGELWGRGAVDMKGGIAAAMMAIGALRGASKQLAGDLWLLASMDEEAVMRGVKAMVAGDALREVGAVVVCEPTSLRVARVGKGRTWATLRVRGRTAHASLKGAGVNAISHAARLTQALENAAPSAAPQLLAGDSFWCITEIEGGIEPAIVPDRCDLTLDARLVPGQSSADLWADVQSVIDRLRAELSSFRCDVDVVERREPWELDAGHPLTRAIVAGVRAATERDPALIAFPGTTDASYMAPDGLPCVICGPGDLTRAHREDERVDVAELGVAARAYARTALEFFELGSSRP
jgi:succinyl-diaminopimelate desuccinylase